MMREGAVDMRRLSITIGSFMLIVSCMLTSCSFREIAMFRNERHNGDIIVELFSAIEKRDEKAIRDLFSKSAIHSDGEFDARIDELFDFVQGELVSYDDWGGPGEDAEKNAEYTWLSKQYSYDVVTTEGKYRLAIKEYTMDTANPDNVGIYSLYIINAEDDPYTEYAYGGDAQWTIGIHFNVVSNILSE